MEKETIREIAYIAWRGAADAIRMYPENKHTFSAYWAVAESMFTKYESPLPNGLPDVKRYDIEGGSGYNQGLAWGVENSTGEYVKYSDYERMRSLAEKEIIDFAEWIYAEELFQKQSGRWYKKHEYNEYKDGKLFAKSTKELLNLYRESCK